MYYIKCNRCSELVEIKSEYMALCPRCKRKMNNSYPAWHERNPEGTYDEYLSEYCVSGRALEGVGQQKRITRSIGRRRAVGRSLIALAVAVVVTAVAITAVHFYGISHRGASIKSVLNSQWRIVYYEDLRVTLKFPYDLELQPSLNVDSLKSDSTQVILGSVSRRWSREGVANVTATRIEYRPDLGINRDMATEQILSAIVRENGVQGLRYVPSDYRMSSGSAGRMFTGSYLIGAQAYEFRAVMAIRDNVVWYFMVSYYRDMPEGTLIAERFFNGILLDN